jgi:hypothetical protein
MTFGAYMRWDGGVALAAGIGLFGLGLRQGHEGLGDAAMSGFIMLAGTGIFMFLRHRAPLREPGAWFTLTPLASADARLGACARRRLVTWLVVEAAVMCALTVGLSALSGYWLTYMDFGVWAVAIGMIKLGPAAAAIADHEARLGTTYRVAKRPLRGVVTLTRDAVPEAGDVSAAAHGPP